MASKRHRHPEILRAFAEQIDWCEMNSTFGKETFDLCGWCLFGLEIHHVMGGPHRIDAAWNLVRRLPWVANLAGVLLEVSE